MLRGISLALVSSFFTAVAAPTIAHDWSEVEPPPIVLLERLVEIIEAGDAAGQFQTQDLDPECIAHDCMEAILDGFTPEDMVWLDTAPEAEMPSTVFGRLPASLTFDMMFDLVWLMDVEEPSEDQALLQDRLTVLINQRVAE